MKWVEVDVFHWELMLVGPVELAASFIKVLMSKGGVA